MRKILIMLTLSTVIFWGCKDRLPQQPDPPDPGEGEGEMMVAYTEVSSQGIWEDRKVMVVGLDGSSPVEIAKGYTIGQAGLNRVAFIRDDSVFVATWKNGGWEISNIPIPEEDPDVEFASVALSPNGKLLTFSTRTISETENKKTLRTYIAHVDGAIVGVPLPVGLAHETTPVFSRDGSRLAFYGVPAHQDIVSNPPVKLWVFNTDGIDHRAVADIERTSPDAYMWLDFSPDGKKIAFQERENTSVYVANTDGTGMPLLVADTAMYPLWSHDGRQIIYYGAPGDILMKNADGTGTTRNLTNTPAQGDLFAQLSPDGKKILSTVFAGQPDEYPGMLKVFDIDNPSNIRTLSTNVYKGFWFRRKP